MARGALSNQLLGKRIVPKPEYGNPSGPDSSQLNWKLWSGLNPDTAGDYHAYIDAAWLDSEHSVKIAVHDPFGNTKEMYLTHVNLAQV